MKPLNEKQRDVLESLRRMRQYGMGGRIANMGVDRGWVAPAEIGGTDGSHHSYTLSYLVKHGLVERVKYGSAARGSCVYRITVKGMGA